MIQPGMGAADGEYGVRRIIWFCLILWLAVPGMGLAEPRIALLIGNGAYTSVSGLPNPPSDAALMARTLEGVGFRVTLVADADLAEMRSAVAAFGAALREAGPDATGLFYYAGHGVQSFGRNYLLPVDVTLSNAADLELVGVEADSVLRQMASAKNRTNIVILDACRNNPFEDVLDLGDNGLAEMKAPTGTFLAYATEPGAVALDGVGGNSPFTGALAVEMVTPGLPIEQAFKNVRVKVLAETGGQQTPWDTSSLTADFVFSQVAVAAEDQLWAQLRDARDAVQIMLFLRAYPETVHAAEAKALLAEVMQDEVAGTGTGPETGTGAGEDAAKAAFDAAQAAGTVQGWEEFLAAHARTPFAEAAKAELAALQPVAPMAEESAPAEALVDQIAAGDVSFDAPLTVGPPEMVGLSIEQLINSTPTFAPVEGLPEAAWKDQPCANCHQWTKQALCDQGAFYVNQPIERAVSKEHPLGGGFRLVLRAWAEGGCR